MRSLRKMEAVADADESGEVIPCINQLPSEILSKIFRYLELKDRLIAELVSRMHFGSLLRNFLHRLNIKKGILSDLFTLAKLIIVTKLSSR